MTFLLGTPCINLFTYLLICCQHMVCFHHGVRLSAHKLSHRLCPMPRILLAGHTVWGTVRHCGWRTVPESSSIPGLCAAHTITTVIYCITMLQPQTRTHSLQLTQHSTQLSDYNFPTCSWPSLFSNPFLHSFMLLACILSCRIHDLWLIDWLIEILTDVLYVVPLQ